MANSGVAAQIISNTTNAVSQKPADGEMKDEEEEEIGGEEELSDEQIEQLEFII